MKETVQIRWLRKPTWHSNVVRGDVGYMSRALAAHYVAHRAAEYIDGTPAPEVTEPEPQLVDPNVEVLGLPEETKRKLNQHWRKKRG